MILLDTNALLWLHLDHPSLGPVAQGQITSSHRVYFSSISVTEMTIKQMLGRLEVPGLAQLPSAFEAAGLFELPLTSRHAVGLLDEPTMMCHDPFDRLLLAQAATHGLRFMTSDATLLRLGRSWIVDACS